MMTLIIAAATAAAQPAAPAPGTPQAQHEHMQMGQAGEHNGMDCCKDCCKDMAAKHEGKASEHSEHNAH